MNRQSDVRSVNFTDLQSENGASHVFNAIYKRDTLTVLKNAYADVRKPGNYRRGARESFNSYKSRSASQMTKLDSHSKHLQLPESSTAIMVIDIAATDENFRISISPSAAIDCSSSSARSTGECSVPNSLEISNVKQLLRSYGDAKGVNNLAVKAERSVQTMDVSVRIAAVVVVWIS